VALSYPFLLALFYGVTVYYTRTSRQLRYLDLENKAPVYAQFLETLEGIVSIRAMGWTRGCFAKSYSLVDNSQQPYYLMYIIQKWLNLVLDMALAGLATLLIGLGVALRGNVGSSAMGVALTQVVSFTGYLKMMVLFLAQMQTSMAAIERIRDFSRQTEREEDDGDEAKVPEMLPGWPSQGGIEIEGLSARYS
jgi:ABC-type multidrug transport system fused ATPase/permease subunit